MEDGRIKETAWLSQILRVGYYKFNSIDAGPLERERYAAYIIGFIQVLFVFSFSNLSYYLLFFCVCMLRNGWAAGCACAMVVCVCVCVCVM